MAVVLSIMLSCLLEVVSTDVITRDLLVIYGTGRGELQVTNIGTKERIKTFQILIDEISGGLAISYERDVIFFADKRTVYQLYLIDEFGNRTISGKGDLFKNTQCNHVENVVYPTVRMISGLSFDRDSNKLSISYTTTQYSNFQTEVTSIDINGKRKKEFQLNVPFYATDFSFGNNPINYISGRKCETCLPIIYRCITSKLYRWACGGYLYPFIEGQTTTLKFTIDKVTNRMFVMQHGSINVLNRNLSNADNSVNMNELNTLVADGRFTRRLQAFDVHGNVVVWTSGWDRKTKSGKVFVGFVNDKGTFIRHEDIYLLDSKALLNPRNIIIF